MNRTPSPSLAAQHRSLLTRLRRGLGALATIGSTAPFIGLFGTVVGIVNAFREIARTGSGGLGAVSAGIAEALVVPALGLLVAIPAVLAYNHLSSRADGLLLAIDQARGPFADHLEAYHAEETVHVAEPARGESKGARRDAA